MALTTAKLSELPSLNFLFSSSPKPTFYLLKPFSSSLRTTKHNSPQYPRKPPTPNNKSRVSSSPWIKNWPPTSPTPIESNPQNRVENRNLDGNAGRSAMERIVLRLRNLGLGSDDEEDDNDNDSDDDNDNSGKMRLNGDEKLGDLLKRDWIRPDSMVVEDREEGVLPWERGGDWGSGDMVEEEVGVAKRRVATAPTLAELTIEDGELRRLRTMGMTLRERINVAKAGVTGVLLQKIHDHWRKSELVRLKFHETLARDMKTAHQIVERRTGGVIIWRSGSVMVVFRGSNYQGPSSRSQSVVDRKESDTIFVPDVSVDNSSEMNGASSSTLKESKPGFTSCYRHVESMTEEEMEYNSLLDGLGPRFDDWWGTGVLPVDADLLPQVIPGYKTPFRLLPTGMRPRLTNAEMTNLRKTAKSLPCHFALGRNRHHQGLAAAIIQLWEKSLVAKIAVKRGIQNTNNKLMADEIKNLTGGVLLLRNKYYIVIYRGKDFVPSSVASALTERREMTKQIQDTEEKVRSVPTVEAEAAPLVVEDGGGQALAGTLAEFYEAQARWGRQISDQERHKMIEEASRAKTANKIKKVEHKLFIAQSKKQRAERLLNKIEESMVPVGPDDDQETITDEERFMFRRVGLRMKAYLPLGIRGVFDGVIENMHLHWKHRELVKLISKQKTLSFVESSARLLEYESGGILVAIERVPKGYALIYYRGKNYRRPITLRPRNLLTKAKALKHSVAMQRHEALSQHISELETMIQQMNAEIGDPKDVGDESALRLEEQKQFGVTVLTKNNNEASLMDSDDDDDDYTDEDDDDDDEGDSDDYGDEGVDLEYDEDSDFSSGKNG